MLACFSKRYGTCDPVDESGPSAADEVLSGHLEQVLRDSPNVMESEQESQKREYVLGALNDIIQDWTREVMVSIYIYIYIYIHPIYSPWTNPLINSCNNPFVEYS